MRAIIDRGISETAQRELCALGFRIVKTMPHPALYEEVRTHPDMQVHKAGEILVCEPAVYEYYGSVLPRDKVRCGDREITGRYPADVAYNVCGMGNIAICRRDSASQTVLDAYERVINVRQGYAKCSICPVGERALITSDEGIARTLSENGFDVLKISPGHVRLSSRMEGFIGGAAGAANDLGAVLFNGDIKAHPDYENIRSFCRSYAMEPVPLSAEPLTDIGSIIIFAGDEIDSVKQTEEILKGYDPKEANG